MMTRRAIAVGIGVVVFILIVLGIRSCLDARSNRALEDYASNVTQLTDETNALGETTFDTIDDPGDLSITDFTDEIETALAAGLVEAERLRAAGLIVSAAMHLQGVSHMLATPMIVQEKPERRLARA